MDACKGNQEWWHFIGNTYTIAKLVDTVGSVGRKMKR